MRATRCRERAWRQSPLRSGNHAGGIAGGFRTVPIPAGLKAERIDVVLERRQAGEVLYRRHAAAGLVTVDACFIAVSAMPILPAGRVSPSARE